MGQGASRSNAPLLGKAGLFRSLRTEAVLRISVAQSGLGLSERRIVCNSIHEHRSTNLLSRVRLRVDGTTDPHHSRQVRPRQATQLTGSKPIRKHDAGTAER
jgi:hypothetical protein